MKLTKLMKNQYFWYAAIAVILSALCAYAPQITAWWPPPLHITAGTSYIISGYRMFFPLAVIFASWKYGIKGGLVVCILVAPVILSSIFFNSKFPNFVIDFLDIALGAVLTWMVGKQGEYKQKLEETAAQLKAQSAVLFKEVNERKKAEEQYRLIAGHTADIIYKLDIKEEQFTYVSPSAERVIGYTPEESVGVKMSSLLTPESYYKQTMELRNAVQKGIDHATLRLDMRHKDGRIIPFEIHATMVFDDKGEPEAVVGVARDITERKKMEEQIIVQDRLASMGQLTSSMAHELNNPLTSIINFSSLLLKREQLPEDVRQDVGTINDEAHRIASTVKNLLSLSRKQPQSKQPVNINDCIRKVLEMRAYEQKVNNIWVGLELDEAIPPVMGNGPLLEQVAFNIIINAEYFMREAHGQGLLRIATQKENGTVRALFTDDGPGISEENLKNIFAPFFSTKEAGRGTGLSLSICHSIITEHGGSIHAESGKDGGTTFIVELPSAK
jgi:PAS domain S-box-containing protein